MWERAEILVFFKAKGPDNLILTSDVVHLAGMPPGEYRKNEQTVILAPEGVVRLPAQNVLAGAASALDRGVENFMRFTGSSLADAIHLATRNPARFYNLTDRGIPRPEKMTEKQFEAAAGAAVAPLLGRSVARSAKSVVRGMRTATAFFASHTTTHVHDAAAEDEMRRRTAGCVFRQSRARSAFQRSKRVLHESAPWCSENPLTALKNAACAAPKEETACPCEKSGLAR